MCLHIADKLHLRDHGQHNNRKKRHSAPAGISAPSAFGVGKCPGSILCHSIPIGSASAKMLAVGLKTQKYSGGLFNEDFRA